MSTLSQIKYEIPRRAHFCASQKELFLESAEMISVLIPMSEGYERRDYCLACFEKDFSTFEQLEGLIYWKTVLSSKKTTGKQYTRDERAIELLRESLADKDQSVLCYVLALYLERRNQLVKRQEKRSKVDPLVFYEVIDTGEILVVKKVELSRIEFDKVQDLLASKLVHRSN